MLSRAADALYWLSRYLERAEHTARALDVQLHGDLDEAPESAGLGSSAFPLGLAVSLPPEAAADARRAIQQLACDPVLPGSIAYCVERARENARQIRDQITADMWEELNGLYLALRGAAAEGLFRRSPHEFFRRVQRGSQLFAGVASATLRRGEGWHFLQLGRYLERTINLCWMLQANAASSASAGQSDAEDFVRLSRLLQAANAYEAFCATRSLGLQQQFVFEFLLLSDEFPFSVRFAANEIQQAIGAIAEWTRRPRDDRSRRLAGRLYNQLAFATLPEIVAADLEAYVGGVVDGCVAIHDAVYAEYISYPIAAALPGQGPASAALR